MFILLFSLLSYWTGTPITSLTNPDYRAYDSPYNYNTLQIGAGWQAQGFDINLAGSYMLDKNWLLTGHYQNQFLEGGDLPSGDTAYGTRFNQSDFAIGGLYRVPINSSLDAVFGGEFSYNWYKNRDSNSTLDQFVDLERDDGSVGIRALTGLRYGLTDNIDLGADIGVKSTYQHTYLQASAQMNYYFTENIALGGKASYDDHDGHIGLYIRITN